MKKLQVIIFTCLICLFATFPVQAFTGDIHNAYLREVLFGNTAVQNKDVLNAINDASELAIDQHNNDSQDILDELRSDYRVRGIPKNVSKFNVGHGNLHRNYTHKGWTYTYVDKKAGIVDEAHWSDVRKKILLKTVNQKFNFGILSGIFGKYDKQCDAFCALIYYVHVIGDHISNTTYHSNYEEIPLVKGYGKYGIIEELLKYSPILFEHQVNDNPTYDSYITALKDLQSKIDDIYYYPDDLDDPEIYSQYHDSAKQLMDCLEDYVPLLIKKEPFFRKVFYPELEG